MRSSLIVLLAAVILATAGAALAAGYPEPQVGRFTQDDLEREQMIARINPIGDEPDWEDTTSGPLMDAAIAEQGAKVLNGDNDTAHYARGSTLIIHVFINHTGGTWTSTEQNAAGAKARIAKDYYLDRAPTGANLSFDYPGSEAYWFYTATLGYFIPDSGVNGTVIEDALANIGFGDSDSDGTRVDDLTLYLQNWGGGWDNVIAVFQADQTGRAWASYGTATTVLYTDSSANVWAHEWGHSHGACDEYVEGGHCNSSIDCGLCQSWYLDYNVNNDNCQLVSCPLDVSCLMINNTFTNICDPTRKHWAWWDGNADGQLDIVERRVSGSTFVNIWELWHNGWFYWNYTGDGMVFNQRWNNWCVSGLRSPAGADYDLRLFADNNHNYPLASSAYVSGYIDFVVGDYNHNRQGNEHIEVSHYSGNTNNYNLTFESGTGVLYPDGISRAVNWSDYNVVRAYDVPLFGGENVTFWAWNVSAGVDVGMALYKSNGDTYFVGRSSYQISSDAAGAGGTESFTYTVPEDDVYGLIVWANSTVNGSFEIQIGPTPATLSEETPFVSGLDLRLFNYDPNAFYWSVVASRTPTSSDVDAALYADENYQTLLATSDDYSGVEFVAVDYNHLSLTRDYWRMWRDFGTDNSTTEWEHDADIFSGYATGSWTSNHVAKVWDFYGVAGQNYFFREYHGGSTFDTGIYIFSSAGGDYYKERLAWDGASNFRPPADGGEWFNYTTPASDWYGFILLDNVGTDGAYSILGGPDLAMGEDVKYTYNNEIVYGSETVTAGYWTAFGVRPEAGAESSVWLYGDDAYTINTLAVSDQSGAGVAFVVGDYNHNPTGAVYTRYWRRSGTGNLDMEWEGGTDILSSTPGTTLNLNWPAGDVVEVYDMYLTNGQEVTITADNITGGLDLGLSMFRSNGGTYYAADSQAAANADAAGAGGSEELTYTADHSDWYGFVIYSKNDNGGNYRLRVGDPDVTAVNPGGLAFGLRTTTANPFTGAVSLQYSLARGGPVAVDIYDVRGRLVRTLFSGSRDAGSGVLVWDGKGIDGAEVPGGVYLARLQSGNQQVITKLVRVE